MRKEGEERVNGRKKERGKERIEWGQTEGGGEREDRVGADRRRGGRWKERVNKGRSEWRWKERGKKRRSGRRWKVGGQERGWRGRGEKEECGESSREKKRNRQIAVADGEEETKTQRDNTGSCVSCMYQRRARARQ